MSKICDVCGLPEELCVCEEIAREVQTVKVFTVRRRFGKLMTIIEGIDEHDIDIKELTKSDTIEIRESKKNNKKRRR